MNCSFKNHNNKLPCWGEIHVLEYIEDDGGWPYDVCACEGHRGMYPTGDASNYKPDPRAPKPHVLDDLAKHYGGSTYGYAGILVAGCYNFPNGEKANFFMINARALGFKEARVEGVLVISDA